MVKTALLSERSKHQDFFIVDIFDSLPIKNDCHTMEHSFFTLSLKKDIRKIQYNSNGISIIANPSVEYGLPTMFDKDILLYCSSLVMAEVNKDKIPPKTMQFSAHDLMITTNRQTNGTAYHLLKNSFERLTNCRFIININTNHIQLVKNFYLLECYKVIKNINNENRMVKIEVTLSDWFHNTLMAQEALTLNKDYFRLRKPLERRLYELARKHCGKQKKWSIKLENLHNNTGSLSHLNKFRFQLKTIIENDKRENHFPDYNIMLSDDDVIFTQKAKKKNIKNGV